MPDEETPLNIRPFLEMADRIKRNASEEFGGAMLIVPPTGDPIAVLFITPTPKEEEPLFWAQCKSKLDVTATERLERQNSNNPWGARR